MSQVVLLPSNHAKDQMPQPLDKLYYLDLALPNDDGAELHDYFNLQFHMTFEFHPGIMTVLQENGDKDLFIKSLTIMLISMTSHPVGPEGSASSIFLTVGAILTICPVSKISISSYSELIRQHYPQDSISHIADEEVQHSLNVSVTDSKCGFPHSNAEAWDPEFSELSKGSRWKLTEFIAAYRETLQHDFAQLTETHKSNYVTQLMQSVRKQVIIRDQPKAVQCKMTTAFKTMDKEWTSLCSSLGIEGFYIAVCGGVEDLSAPKIFCSLKGDKFVCLVLDLEPCHLALKFESFVVSGLADKMDSPPQHKSHSLNKLVGDCRSAIQKGLNDVLHDNGITKTPNDLLPICNPGQLGGRNRVQKLLVALSTKVCYWKKLSEEDRQRRIVLNTEHHAQGEQVYKPCKKHTLQSEKSSATVTSDTNDNGNNDGNDEGDSAV
ncbi:hypothetical protein SCLCIDRAFT_31638 [Scleroderma citrinum Foug A]|uniref:Uncharacterized protein n=1 Tax=Scleroderma citrinum Foug A TaxID=1036808 RepID=A0A0C2ZMB8_9AGAM|nr:hypothetical protein SCLCIDRAFT_31638 [Scleroderma citrinum Foug A]